MAVIFKPARIDLRLSEAERQKIKRAAKRDGKSISGFVVDAAMEKAIMDRRALEGALLEAIDMRVAAAAVYGREVDHDDDVAANAAKNAAAMKDRIGELIVQLREAN